MIYNIFSWVMDNLFSTILLFVLIQFVIHQRAEIVRLRGVVKDFEKIGAMAALELCRKPSKEEEGC